MTAKIETLEAALEDVAQRLERGEIGEDEFDMAHWHRGCLTGACIGGWLWMLHYDAARAAHLTKNEYIGEDRRLLALFYPSSHLPFLSAPYSSEQYAWSATREQAARAIRAYLAGAERPWSAEGVR